MNAVNRMARHTLMPTDCNIVLTGASAGIGAALATTLAEPGRQFLLIGRDERRLDDIAETVRGQGAGARTAAASVVEAASLAEALLAFDADHPVDLIIANAGITSGRDAHTGLEPPGQARRIVDVNLVGMLNTVEPLLPAMMARRKGHIALIASLAAIRPQGDEPGYSAAKAGVRAWGVAMRGVLRPYGIGLGVISPGYVTTAMSERHIGPKPFEMPVERAAALIVSAIRKRRANYTFPWQMAALLWADRFLPPRLSDWCERRLAAELRADDRLHFDGTNDEK